jgi:seryl-tRNA synthetase
VMITAMKQVKEAMQKEEETLKGVMQKWQSLMIRVPNIPDMSVPEGATDADNKEIKTWGDKPTFAFPPKSHIELMEALDLVDFARGVKVAGFRGYILKNDAVLLNFALIQYVTEHLIKKGFTPAMVPSLVNKELLVGSGYLPQGEDDLYRTQDNSYLAGTGEVATMGYYMDEVIDRAQLPVKFLAFSPCFRREAGSHSKDTKGLKRVHEFFKLEQVMLCEASHEESVKWHEQLLENAEEIMQALQLPYHVVLNCAGDLGLGQVKKYDVEAWIPSQQAWCETHSCSYFHDFQSRRLNIRYKDVDGKLKFVHSLNNTAVATPRILIAIVENNQQADGTIVIPPVLRPYMGGRESIGPREAKK